MNKRPRSITVVGWVFVAVGCISLVVGVVRFIRPSGDANTAVSNYQHAVDLAFVSMSAIIAAAGGAFVLRGDTRGRWLCAVWMAAHIILSALHGPVELVVHGLIFGAVAYILFRPEASAYFRRKTMTL